MSARRTSRRRFLRTSLAAASTLAAGSIACPAVFAAGGAPPSERIRIGHVGAGGRGSALLSQSLGAADVDVLSVCDVDRQHLDRAKAQAGARAGAHADYREILDQKDVDAVVIAAPDHWHALITIDACAAGKDVYVEKPLCTYVAEGRAMVKAAREHHRVVQMGIHHRSEDYVRRIVEIVRSGRIGKVRSVKTWMWANPVKEPTPPSAPPAHLDYDRWLGPAPAAPYHPDRVHFNFRWCRDYAGGYMTDWGVHMMNVVTFAMDVDHKGPSRVKARGAFAERNLYDFPLSMEAEWVFEDPDFTLTWTQPSDGGEVIPGERYGMTFYGEAGQLRTSFGAHKFFVDGKEAPLPAGGRAVDVPSSPGHFRNWLECMRSRSAPIADVEIGHFTNTLCILGNIALFTGRELRWDWRKEAFIDAPEADAMLSRADREPYRPRASKAAS
jgi:predicted dehydrogenase